jgi:hypothetical protein
MDSANDQKQTHPDLEDEVLQYLRTQVRGEG